MNIFGAHSKQEDELPLTSEHEILELEPTGPDHRRLYDGDDDDRPGRTSLSSDVSASYDDGGGQLDGGGGGGSSSNDRYRRRRTSNKRSGKQAAQRRAYRPSSSRAARGAGYQRLGGQLADAWHSVTGLGRPTDNNAPQTNDPTGVHDHHHHHHEEDEHHFTDDPEHMSPAMDIDNGLKRALYQLLEEPSSSRPAFWTNIIISFLIVASAVMTTIETIPAFRSAESNRVWFHLESTMVALFTLEYLLRLFAHSDSLTMLKKFVFAPISIIDFISIVPFYIELIAQRDTTYEFRFTILRLFRLLRLFKTYKYSNTIIMTIEVMVVALRRSGDALSALFFFLVTCVVLFSTLLYFAERGTWDETLQAFVDPQGNPSDFDSIPAAFWFVLVTITTTGYGDMVPTTFIGKLVTFPAMMFGVLLIALPSIIVGRNFTIVWEAMRRRKYFEQLQQQQDQGPDSAEQMVPLQQLQQQQQQQQDARRGGSGGADGRQGAFQSLRRPSMAIDDPLGMPLRPRSSSLHTLPGENAPPEPFNLLGNATDDALFEQLHALLQIARQNQHDIQRIYAILEANHNTSTTATATSSINGGAGSSATLLPAASSSSTTHHQKQPEANTITNDILHTSPQQQHQQPPHANGGDSALLHRISEE